MEIHILTRVSYIVWRACCAELWAMLTEKCASQDCAKLIYDCNFYAHVKTLVMCLDVLPACRRNPNMRGVGRDYFV